MSALTEARRPILPHPLRTSEEEEARRLNRNGWIVVVIAALLLGVLLAFASRGDPDILSHLDQSAMID